MKPMRHAAPLLLIILIAAAIATPAQGLSNPRYPAQEHPEITPGQILAHENKLIVYDYRGRTVQILDPSTWEARALEIGVQPNDLAIHGEWLAIAGPDEGVQFINLETGEARALETPGRVEDLDTGHDLIWASIPLQDLILGIDPANIEIARIIELDVASGREKISEANGILWAVSGDGRSIVRIDLGSGARSSLEIGGSIAAIKAFRGGALAATSEDRIIEISEDLKIRRSWSLEGGSSIEIQLYRLDDGRIIYVSPSRWIIGEIEGDRITEVRAEARIGGSALAGDKIWFTEPSKGRIGYAPLSRPPKITAFRIDKIGGEVFRAYLEASDPDGEPLKAYLIAYYPDLMGARQNRTYQMNQEDGRYALEFTVDQGMRAEVYAAVVDPYDNLARSEKVTIRAEKMETITSQQTAQTSQTSAITPADIYALASSLLLFIPIIIAIIYLRGRTRKKRRR